MNKKLLWIWNYWKHEKKNLIVLIIITLLSSIVTVAYPMVFRYLIDVLQNKVVKNTNINQELFRIIGILFLVGIARSIAATYPFFRARMNSKFEMLIRKKYFEKLIRKSQKFYLKHKTGDLLTRLTEDLNNWRSITWFMCSGIFRALDSISKFIFCISVMLLMNTKLTILTVLPVPVMLYVFTKFEERIKNAWQKNKNEISKYNSILENVFSGIKIVKAYNAEEKQSVKLQEKLQTRINLEIENIKLWMIIDSAYLLLGNIGQIMVIFFGGYYVINNQISLGDFYAFYVYLGMLLWPMMDIPQLLINGKIAFVNIDRLEDIKNIEKDDDLNEKDMLEKIKIKEISNISFENVSYKYEASNFEINKLSLNFLTGDSVAICGRVGSGKTTFLKLLLGLIKPTSGNILINNINFEKIDLLSYWQLVGFVPQEPILFADTIIENILLSRNEKLALHKVISSVNMENEIKELENGINTKLTQKGSSVSGGQRQRLSIARALVGNPDLLVFDDCTSALDAENELILWEQLGPLISDKIKIVVTHRPATAAQMKKVIWLKDGELQTNVSNKKLYKEKVLENI